jgi:siroheme synthase
MGGARRAAIAAELIALGWQASTPVALVAEASREGQRTWRGTLEDLSADRAPELTEGPVTIVVGLVAALALSGSDRLPAETETAESRRTSGLSR